MADTALNSAAAVAWVGNVVQATRVIAGLPRLQMRMAPAREFRPATLAQGVFRRYSSGFRHQIGPIPISTLSHRYPHDKERPNRWGQSPFSQY